MSVSLSTKARQHVGSLIVGDPIADFGAVFTTGVGGQAVAISSVSIGNAPTLTTSSSTWAVGQVIAITGFKGSSLVGLPDGLYTIAGTNGTTSITLSTAVTTSGATATGLATLVSNPATAANLVIASASVTSNVATYTTAGNHNLAVGQIVGITALVGLSALPVAGSNGLSPLSELAGPFVVSSSGFAATTFQLNYLSTGAPVLVTGTYTASSGSVVPGPVVASPTVVKGIYSTSTASLTAAPASGASVTNSIKVSGVNSGDLIQAIPPSTIGTNLTWSAAVTAAGTVQLVVSAGTASSGNGSGVWTLLWTRLV